MVLFLTIASVCAAGILLALKPGFLRQAIKTSAEPVPEYCVPAELKIIEEELAKISDSTARQNLLKKKAALESAMQECAAVAQAQPTAGKTMKANAISQFTPSSPAVYAITQGIQRAILMPESDFIPADQSQNNLWAGTANGKNILVLAGILREQDENWRQTHPEWTSLGPQGAVEVLDQNWTRVALIQTPTRNGYVHFVEEHGLLLELQADDGTVFTFDTAKLAFLTGD
jgi:hypothetical protein